MAFTNTYDTATPAGQDDPTEADDEIREVKAAIQERLNVEHVFDLDGTEVKGANTGKHTDITCDSVVNGGDNTVGGNEAITGTLKVTGAGEITGVATVADASLLKTSAAPTTDAMIANKKYVDDTVAAAVPDDDAFGDWASKSTDTAYEAESDGFVCAFNTGHNDGALIGLTDENNPPTTQRVGDRGGQAPAEFLASIMMPVKKGHYWKVTNADTVYWLPVGG